MTECLSVISEQAQDYYKYAPVILLGSGASAAFGLSGMGALADHLIDEVNNSGFEGADKKAWEAFVGELNAGTDLESALHKVTLSEPVIHSVVRSTWELLNHQDLNVFDQAMKDKNLFALGKLLNHLFHSTINEVNIITTNYDRMAEYACEQEKLHHYTGFSHGFMRSIVGRDYLKSDRQVNIWKVHGSLDWFVGGNAVTVGLGNLLSIPSGYLPAIITPGSEKYRRTYHEPFRTIIHHADDALDRAKTYLCVGFGFNDEHIQEKLVNKCVHDNARIILVTHGLSPAARGFLEECHEYLALEAGDTDDETVVHSSAMETKAVVDGNYWSLEGFIKLLF